MSKSKREVKLKRVKFKIEKAKSAISTIAEQQSKLSEERKLLATKYDIISKLMSSVNNQQNEREKKLDYYRRNSLNIAGNGLKASPSSIDQMAQMGMIFRENSYALRSLSRKNRRLRYVKGLKDKLDIRLSYEKEKAAKRISTFEQKVRTIEISAQKSKIRAERAAAEQKAE